MKMLNQKIVGIGLNRGYLVVPADDAGVTADTAPALITELLQLGYILSEDISTPVSVENAEIILKAAAAVTWVDREIMPVYKGFPREVQEIPAAVQIKNQILHYASGGTVLPDSPEVLRPGLSLDEALELARPLNVIMVGDFIDLLVEATFVADKQVTPADREAATALADAGLLPTSGAQELAVRVQTHEKLQLLAWALGASSKNVTPVFELAGYAKTSDSLLRLLMLTTEHNTFFKPFEYESAVWRLADKHFKAVHNVSFPRSLRRQLVQELSRFTSQAELDRAYARRRLWRAILNGAHPYDYAKKNEQAKKVLDVIFENDTSYRTYNSKVESTLAGKNFNAALEVLSSNPGSLARRLVALARLPHAEADMKKLGEAVQKVGAHVSVPVLVSAYNAVLDMTAPHARTTTLAGVGKTRLHTPKPSGDLEDREVLLQALREALKGSFAKNTSAPVEPVPVGSEAVAVFAERMQASAFQKLDVRECIPVDLGENRTLRFFNLWDNTNGSSPGYVDVGVVILDERMNVLCAASWNQYTGDEISKIFTYSGDKYVHVGDSAAEYFDCNLDALAVSPYGAHARYLGLSLQSYSGGKFAHLETLSGVMPRKEPDSGEVFEPATAAAAASTKVNATQALPLVVDLETEELIWLDATSGSNACGKSVLEDDTLTPVLQDALLREKMTVGQLLGLYAEAHGAETTDEPISWEVARTLLKV